MSSRLSIPFVALCLLATTAKAGMLGFAGIPAEYTPDSSFTFDVVLNDYTNVNSYFVELTMSAANSSDPGVDFAFSSATPGDLLLGINGVDFDFSFFVQDLGPVQLISLSGFRFDLSEFSGVSAVVASVTVTTTKDVGDLSISIDPLFTEVLDSNFDPIPNFSFEISPVVSSPAAGVVPEPAGMMIWLAIALTAVVGWRRRSSTLVCGDVR